MINNIFKIAVLLILASCGSSDDAEVATASVNDIVVRLNRPYNDIYICGLAYEAPAPGMSVSYISEYVQFNTGIIYDRKHHSYSDQSKSLIMYNHNGHLQDYARITNLKFHNVTPQYLSKMTVKICYFPENNMRVNDRINVTLGMKYLNTVSDKNYVDESYLKGKMNYEASHFIGIEYVTDFSSSIRDVDMRLSNPSAVFAPYTLQYKGDQTRIVATFQIAEDNLKDRDLENFGGELIITPTFTK